MDRESSEREHADEPQHALQRVTVLSAGDMFKARPMQQHRDAGGFRRSRRADVPARWHVRVGWHGASGAPLAAPVATRWLNALLADPYDYDVIFVDSIVRGYSRVKELRPDMIVIFALLDDPGACQLLSMLTVDRDTRGPRS